MDDNTLKLLRDKKETVISDPWTSKKASVNRLLEEWRKYHQLIIAFDYDNTVYDYYGRGYIFERVIKAIRDAEALGFHLTVFTCCNEDRYAEITEYLNKQRIPFHSINETPEHIPFRGRKVFYNWLLDDRAGLGESLDILETVIAAIRSEKAMHNLDDIA